MSQSEYATFAVAVLQPIRGNGYLLNDAASIVFKKQGANWRLTASSVVVGTVRYTVIATVPNSEVEKTSTDTTNSINATVVSMVIAFAFCIVGFLVILVGYAWYMIKLIVNPVNDLRAVFAQNNLAAAELALGNKKEAENYSKLAIENAETIVHNLESKGAPAADIDKARRVLSDRK
eukprot:gene33193-38526_t